MNEEELRNALMAVLIGKEKGVSITALLDCAYHVMMLTDNPENYLSGASEVFNAKLKEFKSGSARIDAMSMM